MLISNNEFTYVDNEVSLHLLIALNYITYKIYLVFSLHWLDYKLIILSKYNLFYFLCLHMVSISIQYQGDLHCQAIHGPSNAELSTDAPIDNNGKGESFSPTDLLATALGTCILTIMGIAANTHNINIKGTTLTVVKHMINQPVRRIGSLAVSIILPKQEYSAKELDILILAAKTCPVMQSIHPDISVNTSMEIAS
jgi:putative redox protein